MRLVDCFMALIVYVVVLVRDIDQDQPEVVAVQNEIKRFLAKSLKIKSGNHISNRSYHYGRFLICTWIDEALLNSAWIHKRKWEKALLQRRLYNITDGGVVFFNCMAKLGHEHQDIQEVAYYCLTLGFAGRYVRKQDTIVLEHLKTSSLKQLYGRSAEDSNFARQQLFAEAYQKEILPAKPKKRMWSWRAVPFVIGLASVGVFAGLVLFYQYLLNVDLKQFIPM